MGFTSDSVSYFLWWSEEMFLIIWSLQDVIILVDFSIYDMQPTPLHLTVKEYVTPEKFAFWKDYGESIGFRYVASGPMVNFSS